MSWFKKKKPQRVPINLSLGVRATTHVKLTDDQTWSAKVTYEAVTRDIDAPLEPWLDVHTGKFYTGYGISYWWTMADFIQVTWGEKKTQVYGIPRETLEIWESFLRPFEATIEDTFTTVDQVTEELREQANAEFGKRLNFWLELDTVVAVESSDFYRIDSVVAEVDDA